MKISSGSDLFDEFLEGGYETDTLTTLYGSSGTGKTTLCILAALARTREKKKVIYIDSEGGFSAERLKQLAGAEEHLMESIIILKPTSLDEQTKALEKLKALLTPKIGMIVVDTATFFYRLEMAKNEEVKTANNKLIWQVSYLTEIARKKNIPVLVTNQVYSDFNNKDEVKMVGGDILRYNSKCLIKLDNKEGKRKATLITHRSIPEGREMEFAIINEGIVRA